jgi:hypothetical protein
LVETEDEERIEDKEEDATEGDETAREGAGMEELSWSQ